MKYFGYVVRIDRSFFSFWATQAFIVTGVKRVQSAWTDLHHISQRCEGGLQIHEKI